MKRIFTFAIALMSMFAMQQKASALVYTATVPEGTFECYIAGDFPAPMNWSPKDGKMTKVDATHFTIDLPAATESTQYKYCSGPDWAFVEKHADGTEIRANRVYSGTNAYVDPTGVNPSETAIGTNGVDVVVKWLAIFDPTVPPLPMDITIDALTPAGTIECYIAGSFNDWAGPTAPNVKMTKVSETVDGVVFTITFHVDDANKLAYKFCSGPDWAYEMKTPAADFKYPEVAPVVTEWKKLYDPTKLGDVKITATVPVGTDSCWIQGSFLGWDMSKAIKGTKIDAVTYQFIAKGVQSIEYRIYNFPDWGYPETDDLGTAGSEHPNRLAEYTMGGNNDVAITVAGWKKAYVPAGINEVKAATNAMTVENNSIVVKNVLSQVALFDLAGRSIQSENMTGTFTSKALKAGMYIVRVDGATRKMSVK